MKSSIPLRAEQFWRESSRTTIFLLNMLNGLWGFHFTRGHVKPAVEFSREMMAVAEELNDPGSIRDADGAIGSSLVYTGDLLAARRHLEQAARPD